MTIKILTILLVGCGIWSSYALAKLVWDSYPPHGGNAITMIEERHKLLPQIDDRGALVRAGQNAYTLLNRALDQLAICQVLLFGTAALLLSAQRRLRQSTRGDNQPTQPRVDRNVRLET